MMTLTGEVHAVTASDEAAFAVFRGAVDMAAVIDDDCGLYVNDADFTEYIDRGRAQAAVHRTGGRDHRSARERYRGDSVTSWYAVADAVDASAHVFRSALDLLAFARLGRRGRFRIKRPELFELQMPRLDVLECRQHLKAKPKTKVKFMAKITIRNLGDDRETVVVSFYPSLEAPDPNRSIRQVSDKQTLLALLTEWDDVEMTWESHFVAPKWWPDDGEWPRGSAG